VTTEGRVACVIFALFGAPLAIIAIGDMGKFLSECTIWLYKRLKHLRNVIRMKMDRINARNNNNNNHVSVGVESVTQIGSVLENIQILKGDPEFIYFRNTCYE
jgi:hypothetical protein